ncbi:uncharacterized protein ACHE_50971S [Aspergillus chevalieri]|uniref:VIT domain-containing protein n=1 Tax=Aspergillus chevalieri TaxID=182096 RepID=A0A7R7VS25_ASPCH|nr:uncharacterized protein ACHE_50971S [Aspergillus chevalieri]BCR89773.1 hypothetical protein ACHE_50971S [Aspergillus chevalieri]
MMSSHFYHTYSGRQCTIIARQSHVDVATSTIATAVGFLAILPRGLSAGLRNDLSSISRTVLTQTFTNPSSTPLKGVSYTFPLYDGVSVVDYICQVGDRVLYSQVKFKEQANKDYTEAVSQGRQASVLDYSARDVLNVRLGNVKVGEQVVVEITFLSYLKQDAQADGVRYTFPNILAPRYGSLNDNPAFWSRFGNQAQNQSISITVDVLIEKP